MAKHVFLSFVVEDLQQVSLFRGQARNENSDLIFDDYSVKEPYHSTNAEYIKRHITERIRATSVTVCLIGSGTYRSQWVTWEIDKSYDLANKVFGVRLYSDKTCPTPTALGSRGAAVYGWNIDAIVKAIG